MTSKNIDVLANKNVKKTKPFSDRQSIKECLVDSVAILIVFTKSVSLKKNCYKVG